MKIKKGDTVVVIAGKDRGKTGKVMKALPKEMKLLVEGINVRKKHMRARKQGEKGQVITMSFPMDISNAKLLCARCGKATRVGYSIENGNKTRICKKCKQAI